MLNQFKKTIMHFTRKTAFFATGEVCPKLEGEAGGVRRLKLSIKRSFHGTVFELQF